MQSSHDTSENKFYSGVSCDTSLPPLCIRPVETSTTIEEECDKCPADNSVTCNKWVDLEDYPATSGGIDIFITGAEICVESCGGLTEPGPAAEIFCNVSLFVIL